MGSRSLCIGVLAVQGDVAEHQRMLASLGADTVQVRRPASLEGIDGLIIPGGESTTIGMLAQEYGLIDALRERIRSGMPVWGTCAGLILLARDIGRDQPLIGGLDVKVDRNAFGRQVDSFETELKIAGLDGEPFCAVFIRAPLVAEAGAGVEILARLEDGTVVAVRQGGLLGTSFHPELTDDNRLHALFLDMVAARRPPSAAPTVPATDH